MWLVVKVVLSAAKETVMAELRSSRRAGYDGLLI